MTSVPVAEEYKLVSVHLGPGTVPPTGPNHRDEQSSRSLRQVVSVPELSPAACGWPEPPDYPRFAAVEENWFASLEELRIHVQAVDAGPSVWHYHVEEHVRRDDRPLIGLGQRMPGVKEIFLLTRPDGTTRSQFAEHWLGVHHPLALRHHIGMWKYVQNVVIEQIGDFGRPFDGIAELHYPSLQDARTRRYDSEEGRSAIAADRPRFVGDSVGLFTGEVCRRR